MITPSDVPSPIDLQSDRDAVEWERNAMTIRPWRTEFFDSFAAEVAKVKGPVRVLELGSGPGFLAAHLFAAIPELSMVLLDFSSAMHRLAQARLSLHLDRISFVERSFKDAEWTSSLEGFDFVVTHQAVHELRHKRYAPVLHEQVRGVLSANGKYLVGDHYAGDGGMKNTDLYMTVQEHRDALVGAGFGSVRELLKKGGMILNCAA
jgi:ubiquinone/menaquinone biosynthesis C-methylase UbiE